MNCESKVKVNWFERLSLWFLWSVVWAILMLIVEYFLSNFSDGLVQMFDGRASIEIISNVYGIFHGVIMLISMLFFFVGFIFINKKTCQKIGG